MSGCLRGQAAARLVRMISAAACLAAAGWSAALCFVPGVSGDSISAAGMLGTALLAAVLLYVPPILEKLVRKCIPAYMQILYSIFLLCAMVLGNVFGFYDLIPHWDDFLHGSSSFLSAMFGALLLSWAEVKSGFVRAGGAFSFSMAVGGVWEIIEFIGDGVLGMNAQRFLATEDGAPLLGRAALADTMTDLIVDFAGAVCAAVVVYILANRKKRHTDENNGIPL